MAGGWVGSNRLARLPADWQKRRARTLRRDGHRCTWVNDYGERCDEPATEVDHIKPGDNHDDSNLRSLCEWHHQKKSSQEGGRANAIKRARHAKKFVRLSEPHPGLIA